MAELFVNGRFVDLILVLVVIEAVILVLYWQSRQRGIPPIDLLPSLLAGAFLLLALRLTLGDAPWQPCCGSLAAAGLSHLVDLRRRWRE